MEIEAMTGEYTKNGILNEGAELYLDLLQTRRSFRSHGDPTVKHKILQGFLLKHFPEAAGISNRN